MINDLPTIFEVVTGAATQVNNNYSVQNNKISGRMQPRHPDSDPKGVDNSAPMDEDERGEEEEEEEEDDKQGATLCGACGDSYTSDEFWIGCDICERWFHGRCVKITPAKAERMKQYDCPSCSLARGLDQLFSNEDRSMASNPSLEFGSLSMSKVE